MDRVADATGARGAMTALMDALLLLLLGLLPATWFGPGELAAGGDIGFPLDPIGWFIYRQQLWDYRVNAGAAAAVHATTLSFHAIQAALAAWGMPLVWVQRLAYVFWNTAIGFSIYGLLRVIEPGRDRRLFRWIGIGIYVLNPFLFNAWEAGKASILSAFVLFPCLLTLLIGMLHRQWPRIPSLAGVALIAVLTGGVGADPPLCALLLVVGIIAAGLVGPSRPAQHPWRVLCLVVIVWLLASASWLLPYAWELGTKALEATEPGLGAFNLGSWLKGISTHTSLFNVARLQATWDWYYTWNLEPYSAYAVRYFSNPLLIVISLLWPVMAFGALLGRRTRLKWLFAALGLLGVFGGAGVHPPTGGVFLWLTEHAPGFFVFRSPYYKFGILVPLSYAVLIPYAWTDGWQWLRRRVSRDVPWRSMTGGLLLAANLIYATPLLTGEIIYTHRHSASTRLQIPPYVMAAARWLSTTAGPGRILSLPQDVADMYRWGYGSLAHVLTLACDRAIFRGIDETTPTDQLRNLCYTSLYQGSTPFLSELLDVLGIRYLLLRKDAWYDFYGDTDSPRFIAERLRAQQGIRRSQTIGPWDFYEVTAARRSLVQAVAGLTLLIGPYDGLIPWSYPNPEHDTRAIVLPSDLRQRAQVREWLNHRTPLHYLLYDSSILDAALDLTAQENRFAYDASHDAWTIDCRTEGLYELWFASPPMKPRGCSHLLLDDTQAIGPARAQAFQALRAHRWTRLTAKMLTVGHHRLRPLGRTNDPLPLLVAVRAEHLDAWTEVIRQRLQQPDARLTMVRRGELHLGVPAASLMDPMPRVIPANMFPARASEIFGDDWQWLQPGAAYVVINPKTEPVRTNIRMEVCSPDVDRTLYVSLDGKLFQNFHIKAGEPMPITFENIELPPAEHRLDLYVLEGTLLLRRPRESNARLVTMAVRHFAVGPSVIDATFLVPRPGRYWVRCYPFPIDQPHNLVAVALEEKPLPMTQQHSADGNVSWWTSATPLALAEDPAHLTLVDRGVGSYYVVLEEAGAPADVPPPQIQWRRDTPTHYTVHVAAGETAPWYLIIRDAFDRQWHASVSREQARAIPLTERFQADGFANAWGVPGEQGHFAIEAAYAPQELFRRAWRVSLGTVVALLLLAGAGQCWRRRKRAR